MARLRDSRCSPLHKWMRYIFCLLGLTLTRTSQNTVSDYQDLRDSVADLLIHSTSSKPCSAKPLFAAMKITSLRLEEICESIIELLVQTLRDLQ